LSSSGIAECDCRQTTTYTYEYLYPESPNKDPNQIPQALNIEKKFPKIITNGQTPAVAKYPQPENPTK